MPYKETMPSVLSGMDPHYRQAPPQKSSVGKYLLAVIVLISILVLYLR